MVHTPIRPAPKTASKVEGLKAQSYFLREPLATELKEDTNHFTDTPAHL